MVSVRTLATLKRGGVYHPPGTEFHDFDEEEAAELGRYVERIEARLSPAEVEKPLAAPPAPAPDTPAEEAPEEDGRVEQIARAVDLLDAEDFTRTGRPAIPALAEVLGFKPTADEITAALAMREAEGL